MSREFFFKKLTSFKYYFFGQQRGEHLEHTKDIMECWKHIERCWGTMGKWQGVLGSIQKTTKMSRNAFWAMTRGQ
jgi:hypothetical protein